MEIKSGAKSTSFCAAFPYEIDLLPRQDRDAHSTYGNWKEMAACFFAQGHEQDVEFEHRLLDGPAYPSALGARLP